MNWKEARKRTLNVALMFVFLLGAGFVASAPAQAQNRDYRYNQGGRGPWDENRTEQAGLIFGYLRGYIDGRVARNYGSRIDYNDTENYRNDSLGWISGMHFRDEYRKRYRAGYELGFKESQSNRRSRYSRSDFERVLNDSMRNVYDQDILAENLGWYDRGRRDGRWNDRDGRYDRYDRSEVYRIAQQNGYREGLEHGNQDRARRRNYDYDDSSEYRNALVGYRSEYGDRSAYQQAFREGYRRGYDEGYRRGNNGRGWPWR
ncbi:MAG TPA: hypothetical protein VFQ92_13985 [Blastocatellia bacterium]|nr:hypothetical protein [Blastocatellia bacterium]